MKQRACHAGLGEPTHDQRAVIRTAVSWIGDGKCDTAHDDIAGTSLADCTRMQRLLIGIVIVVASDAGASPNVAAGLDYTAARGSTVEHLDLGVRLEAGLFVRVGSWQATGSFSALMNVRSDLPTRDGNELTGMGLGGRLAYHHAIGRNSDVMAAIGFERIWLSGHEPIRRGCRQTDMCLAGYYTETADYNAWAPQLRVGFGLYANPRNMVVAGTFELIVEPVHFKDIPPDGLAGVAVFAAFTATIGGGSRF